MTPDDNYLLIIDTEGEYFKFSFEAKYAPGAELPGAGILSCSGYSINLIDRFGDYNQQKESDRTPFSLCLRGLPAGGIRSTSSYFHLVQEIQKIGTSYYQQIPHN